MCKVPYAQAVKENIGIDSGSMEREEGNATNRVHGLVNKETAGEVSKKMGLAGEETAEEFRGKRISTSAQPKRAGEPRPQYQRCRIGMQQM